MLHEIKLEEIGKWWFPSGEFQYRGTLSFDNSKGAILTISGDFPVPMEIHNLRSKEDFLILGEFDDGRKLR